MKKSLLTLFVALDALRNLLLSSLLSSSSATNAAALPLLRSLIYKLL